MRFVIDISEYDKEWIGNACGIPQEINTKIAEAIINAEPCQPELHYDEWCDSCQEYDHNKHCCPRWNKVIKNTVEELKAAQPEIMHCGDGCKFWNRHAGERVGACDILRQCTFESFYCGNAKRKEVTNGN